MLNNYSVKKPIIDFALIKIPSPLAVNFPAVKF